MALPTLDKTWQYSVNTLHTTTGVGLTDQRTVLLAIVNKLLGFGTLPWTCSGSSDSVAFSMDGTNRWSAIANLVFTTSPGTAHSWIVLRQAGINTKTEICIDLISPAAAANTNGCFINVVMSPVSGFGTVNGGTNGSLTARATATDEVVVYSSSPAANFLDGTSSTTATARDYITHAQQSTDGQCTRVIVRIPGSRFSALFQVEKPKSPGAGWTNPVFGRWQVSTVNVTDYVAYSDSAVLGARAASTSMLLYMTSEGWANQVAGRRILTKNELENSWELYGIGLASETVLTRGRHGRIFDMYFASTQHAEGDTFPNSAARTFLVLGDLVIPWNGTSPLMA